MRTMTEIMTESMSGETVNTDLLNRNSSVLLGDLCNFSPLEDVPEAESPTIDDDQQPRRRSAEDDGSREEREERSAALERTYVYDVYEQIAPHFRDNHHRPWPRVQQFLTELEPGSLVCDVGCGNGKYLDLNADVFTLGADRCHPLGEVARERGHEVTAADNMALPFRDECFDAALSVAVVHHFATTERRVQALRELARVLRIGGRLMITVWALEQRHRKFESQDVLVPWHKPLKSSSEDQTSLEKEIASTTTSDDDILNYHAYTSGMESEPYFVPACFPRKKHRFRDGWVRYRGKNLDSCRSSSQSSSDLSSPNETCYSFVRRALQKLSSSGSKQSWDDPHTRCRPPWFLQSADSIGSAGSRAAGCRSSICSAGGNMLDEKQDSLDSNENADDIPIELHDLDNEMFDEEEYQKRRSSRDSYRGSGRSSLSTTERPPIISSTTTATTTTTTTSKSPKCLQRSTSTDSPQPTLVAAHKSKSLGDILSLFGVNFLQPRKTSADLTHSDTTSSSSVSLAKLSSTSSLESRGRSAGSTTVTRSKSTHLTLAKVEEDGEQPTTGQQQTPFTDERYTYDRKSGATGQQRWSVAGYPASCTAAHPTGSDDPDGQGVTRRPRSLVLGYEMHIPRTLSAEDHKNGNTILPDLEGCLSLYGLTGGGEGQASQLSPPYGKVVDEPQDQVTKETDQLTTCAEPTETRFSVRGGGSGGSTSDHSDDVSQLTPDNNKKNARLGCLKTSKVCTDLDPAQLARAERDRIRHDKHRQHLQQCLTKTFYDPGGDDTAARQAIYDPVQSGPDKLNLASLIVNTVAGEDGSSKNNLDNDSKMSATEFHKWPCGQDIPKSVDVGAATVPPQSLSKCPNVWQDLFFSNLINFLIDREHLFPYRSMPNLNARNSNTGNTDGGNDELTSYVTSYPMTPQEGGVLGAALSGKINQQPGGQPRRRFSQPSSLAHLHDLKSNIALYSSQGTSEKKFGDSSSRNGYSRRRLMLDEAGSPKQHPNTVVHYRNLQRPLLRRRSCVCDRVTIRERFIRHSYSADDTALRNSILTMDSVVKHGSGSGGHHIIAKEDSLQSDTSADSDDSVASVIVVQRDRVPSLDLGCSLAQQSGSDSALSGGREVHSGRSERFGSACSKDSSNHSDTSVESEESCISVIPMPNRGTGNCSDCDECDLADNHQHPNQHTGDDEQTGDLLESEPTEDNSAVEVGKSADEPSDLQPVIFIKDDNEKQNIEIDPPELEPDHEILDADNDEDNFLDDDRKELNTEDNSKAMENNSLLDCIDDHAIPKFVQSVNQALPSCVCSSPLSDNRYMDLKMVERSFEDEDDEEVDRPIGEDLDEELEETYDQLAAMNESRCSSFDDDKSSVTRPTGIRSSVSWEKYLDACESLVLDSIFYVNAGHSDYSEQHDSIADILPSLCRDYEMGTAHCYDSQVAMTAETCWLDPTSSSGATDSWKSSDSIGDDDASELDGLHSLSDDLLDDELRLDISHEPVLPDIPSANSPQGRLLEAAVGVANSLQSTVTVAIASTMPRKHVVTETMMVPQEVKIGETHAVVTYGSDELVSATEQPIPTLLIGFAESAVTESCDLDEDICVLSETAVLPTTDMDTDVQVYIKQAVHVDKEHVDQMDTHEHEICQHMPLDSEVELEIEKQLDSNIVDELLPCSDVNEDCSLNLPDAKMYDCQIDELSSNMQLDTLSALDEQPIIGNTKKDDSSQSHSPDANIPQFAEPLMVIIPDDSYSPDANCEDVKVPFPDSNSSFIGDLPMRTSFHSSEDEDDDIGAREEMASEDEDVFPIKEEDEDVSDNDYDIVSEEKSDVKEETLQIQKRQVCEDMINGNIPGNRKLLKQMAQECGLSWAALKGIDGLNLGSSESRSSSSCGGGSPRRKSDSEAVELSLKAAGESSGHHQAMCRGKSLEFSSLVFRPRIHHPQQQQLISCDKPGGASMSGRGLHECAPIQYQIQEEEESMSRSQASSSDMTGSLESSSFRMGDLLAGDCSIPQSPLATTNLPAKLLNSPPPLDPTTICPMSISIESHDSPPSEEPKITCSEIDTVSNVPQPATGDCDLMQTSMASSIENHFGNLEFVTEGDTTPNPTQPGEDVITRGRHHRCGNSEEVTSREGPSGEEGEGVRGWREGEEELDQRDSLSISTSDDSILSGSENGGSATYHRYYHVFREGELDHLIDKYVENLHIISSYYDHANWCIIAEKVQVWRI